MAAAPRKLCSLTPKKRQFRSSMAAELALSVLWGPATLGQTGKLPVRAYLCEDCSRYHLTSMPEPPKRTT